jgi:hypothetical protein
MTVIRHNLHRLLQTFILLDFALIPAWWKRSSAPVPFSPDYVTGFVLWSTLAITVMLWCLNGCSGWRRLFRNGAQSVWTIAALLLVCWSALSISWAYGSEDYPGIAPNYTLQMLTITAFALVVVSAAPDPRLILTVLALSAALHGIIGLLQVGTQQSLGLRFFGEFRLDPARSGVSVIQSGDLRWLRPYGLLPHPNIYAGVIAAGTLAAFGMRAHRLRLLLVPLLFWVLLLTFSRGAWIAFALAFLPVVFIAWRDRQQRGDLRLLLCILVASGALFIASYQNLLLARTGIVQEGIEQRSISDRLVYSQIAWDAIQFAPIQGVGAANFPWYASNYLFFRTDFDLRGDHVHNIYLGILAEFGVIGAIFFAVWVIAGMVCVWRDHSHDRLLLLACLLLLLIIGIFDHYPRTLLHTQTLFYGVFAAALRPDNA